MLLKQVKFYQKEIKKYKRNPIFIMSGMFIDIGESIHEYMTKAGHSKRKISKVMKRLQSLENAVFK